MLGQEAPATRPAFTVLLSPGVAPCTVHVNGLTIAPQAGTPLTAHYDWDFGDPRGRFDKLSGFNAAHTYNFPGQYTIALLLTDEAGHQITASATVTITADTRHRVFVAPEGSDMNTGTSPDTPYQSLARAFKAMPNDGELLLRAGATYNVTSSLHLNRRDVLIGRFGDGPDPVVMRIKGNGTSTFSLDKNCDGVTVEHITFDSPNAVGDNQEAPKVGAIGVLCSGSSRNITVRNCTFRNVDDGVNANGKPTGLLVQDCSAPLVTGVRGYLIWGEGTDHVYLGNSAANSTREHNVRLSGVQRVLIDSNHFANLDRHDVDKYDGSKGCIEMHRGEFAWISHNDVTGGTIRVGPRGGQFEGPESVTEWCVIDANALTNTGILAYGGSRHIMVRNNIIRWDGNTAIVINGAPTSEDITIVHNTAINNGELGAFFRLWGHVNGITLSNNLFVAPNLKPGSHGSSAVGIDETDLASFSEISHNVWPDPGSEKGMCIIGTGKSGGGLVSAQQWSSFSVVKQDRFANVTVDDRGVPQAGSAAEGYAVPTRAVTHDYTGRPRPLGERTVGALEPGLPPATHPAPVPSPGTPGEG
ncbi:MAG TPA: right-handed parallel beta-helix repeat-containing protein [Tepidisphaeraceae bacterium]|nr:right-handed parallel beta-helix repeat-containing protein [Tepidisphaeraceae bacterium]